MPQTLAVVAIAVCGVLLVWAGTIWGIARLGAWHHLAAFYPARGEPQGNRLTWQSAMVGGVRYKGSLVFVLAREGLYLAPMRLFDFGHRPLLIAWRDVAAARPVSEPASLRRGVRLPSYQLELQAGRRAISLRLPVELIARARQGGLLQS